MIYLDHAATSPIHPEVIEAMNPYLYQFHGNPSSIHQWGRNARAALEGARETIAKVIHAEPSQLVFTSGGTESDNMALFGVAMANRDKGKHIITTQIEHHAILHTCSYLEELGFEVTYLPVDQTGKVAFSDLETAVRPDTILVSMMYGNNEVGTIQDLHQFGSFLREKGIPFHSDGVQALGALPLDMKELPVDMMSFSAHKINGPKGIGALYLSKSFSMVSFLWGGSQERNRRAGTENLAGAVGFAKAVEIMQTTRSERIANYHSFKKAMIHIFEQEDINFRVNGHPTDSLPHILNISFPGFHTETLLMNLDLEGIAAASGSACSSGSLEPSHVLQAMGLDDSHLKSAIRFSFGLGNTIETVEAAANKLVAILKRGRVRG